MTDQTLKDIDRAFKALEERDELLDKIESEIDKAYDDLDGYDPYALGTFANMVSEIIDKYRKGANE